MTHILKCNRSVVLRMAGNIAAGLVDSGMVEALVPGKGPVDHERLGQAVVDLGAIAATLAVRIAQEVVREVDAKVEGRIDHSEVVRLIREATARDAEVMRPRAAAELCLEILDATPEKVNAWKCLEDMLEEDLGDVRSGWAPKEPSE